MRFGRYTNDELGIRREITQASVVLPEEVECSRKRRISETVPSKIVEVKYDFKLGKRDCEKAVDKATEAVVRSPQWQTLTKDFIAGKMTELDYKVAVAKLYVSPIVAYGNRYNWTTEQIKQGAPLLQDAIRKHIELQTAIQKSKVKK